MLSSSFSLRISPEQIEKHAEVIKQAGVVCLDSNLNLDTISCITKLCRKYVLNAVSSVCVCYATPSFGYFKKKTVATTDGETIFFVHNIRLTNFLAHF